MFFILKVLIFSISLFDGAFHTPFKKKYPKIEGKMENDILYSIMGSVATLKTKGSSK